MTWGTDALDELRSTGATFDQIVAEAMRLGVSPSELMTWWHDHSARGAIVRSDAASGPVRYKLVG